MTTKTKIIRWSGVLAIFIVGLFTCLSLTVNDNALDLLPENAVSGDIEKLKNMGLVDRLFITLTINDAGGKDAALGGSNLVESVERLGAALEKSDLFSFVLFRLPKGYESGFMRTIVESLPLLLDNSDYGQLERKITSEGIATGLAQSFALLNSPAGIGLKKHVQLDPLGFSLLGLEKLNYLRSELSMAIEDGFFMAKDNRSCLLIAEATKSLTDSKEAEVIRDFLEETYGKTLAPNIEARVIGSLPHTLANATTIQGDLKTLLPVATLLLVCLLGVALRSVKGFLVLAIPLMAAAPAIGLSSLIHGGLSRLALGFGIVLLGIAVDFSIHLYLGQKVVTAGGTTSFSHLKRPIFFATLTTSAVFIILLFSGVPSHRQMATLALIGLLFAVAFSWVLVPTIGRPVSRPVTRRPAGRRQKFLQQRTVIMLVWAAVLGAGIYSWPQLHYNGDLRALDVPDKQVIEDERFFSKVWGEKGEQAFVLVEAENTEDLFERNYKVFNILKQDSGLHFQSLAPLLPGATMQNERRQRWQEFWRLNKDSFSERFLEAAREKGFSDRAFEPFFSWLAKEPLPLTYETYLQGSMAPLVQSLVKERAVSPHYYVMTTVALKGKELATLSRLETEIPGVTVIANAKWRAAVERGLRHDILFLSAAAGIVIVILAALQFKNILSVFAVLAPVFSALSAMSVFAFLTTGELNMMHLIMGIMVIGLSVDYGIFTVCACQDKQHSESGFAVSICAASSLIGFGVLAFAAHPALHALGVTVLAGIGVAWPTALFVSPVILSYKERN
ncbi:MAG: hypothetical protein COA36_02260 [Desulfotalea sp.]|nr:MAG: hypothetical protein COA36_02260 [Desulfotalea sp.]